MKFEEFQSLLAQSTGRKFTSKPKEEIYFKTIISTVTYGIIVSGTCSLSLMNDIERIHARAAKTIHRLPKHISDEDALEAAKLDKIEYIYKSKVLSKMHQIFYGKCPEVLRSQVNKRDKERKRFTIPRCTKEIGRTSIKYRGPLPWNSLPFPASIKHQINRKFPYI